MGDVALCTRNNVVPTASVSKEIGLPGCSFNDKWTASDDGSLGISLFICK